MTAIKLNYRTSFPIFDAFIEKYDLSHQKRGNVIYLGSMLKWALYDLKKTEKFHKQMFSRTKIVWEEIVNDEDFLVSVDLMPDPLEKGNFADGLTSRRLLLSFFSIFKVMKDLNLIKGEYKEHFEKIIENLAPFYILKKFGNSDLEEMVEFLVENMKKYVFLFQNGFIFPIYEIRDDLETLFSDFHNMPHVHKGNSDYSK